MASEKTETPGADDEAAELLRQAAMAPRGITAELWDFLKQNKKWWLGPPIIALLLLGLLMVFGGSTAGPFVYTLF